MVNRSKQYCMFGREDAKELLMPPVELLSLNGGTFILAPSRHSPTMHMHCDSLVEHPGNDEFRNEFYSLFL